MSNPASITLTPGASATDRLGLTLFFAVALHAIGILGITFEPNDKKSAETPRSMEVILVHSKGEEAPEEAEYLAQVSQQGGGEVQEKVRPSSPFTNTARNDQGTAAETRPLMAPQVQQTPEPSNVVTTERSRLKTQINPGEQRPEVPEAVNAAELIPPSEEIARLAAEISQRIENYAKMPRHKYITASTREYVAASYESAWRMKVERIGNLNYPDEARRANLSGHLLLDVAINPDGSLHGVEVIRSSGHRVLDEGAIRIVRLAAPYAPLPESLRQETDILHIVRTWQFEAGHRLEMR